MERWNFVSGISFQSEDLVHIYLLYEIVTLWESKDGYQYLKQNFRPRCFWLSFEFEIQFRFLNFSSRVCRFVVVLFFCYTTMSLSEFRTGKSLKDDERPVFGASGQMERLGVTG